jgi:hypothetical protein
MVPQKGKNIFVIKRGIGVYATFVGNTDSGFVVNGGRGLPV